MKTLLFTLLCVLTFGQTSFAQKLYAEKATVQSIVNNSNSISESVTVLETDHKAKAPGSTINRTELTKLIFMATGGADGLAREASNSENVTADRLAKMQMYESEYDEFIKSENKGGGYYQFLPGDADNLSSLSLTLRSIKEQLKTNGYRIAPGLDNADENLVLLQQFTKTYSKFAQVLETRFVEL